MLPAAGRKAPLARVVEMLETEAGVEEETSSVAVALSEEESSGGAEASERVEYSAEARSACWIVTRPPPSVNE